MSLFNQIFQSYIDRGYSVIPIRPNAKGPLIKDWSEFSTRLPAPNELATWRSSFNKANIGLCCGDVSGVIAFDFDLDPTNPEQKAIYDAIKDLLPASPFEKIGKKGFTRFFKYSGETNIKKIVTLGSKKTSVYEVLSTKNQTVLPPSIHCDTGLPYRWTGKALHEVSASDLPVLDKSVLQKLNDAIDVVINAKLSPPPTSKVEPQEAERVFGEGSRNISLTSIAGALKKKGLNEDALVDALRAINKKQCSPPLSDDEVEQIARSVARYENESINGAKSSFTFTSLKDLYSKPVVEEEWIVDGFLPIGGTSILAGKPKAGKSTLVRNLINSIVGGSVFLDRKTKKGRVLYLAFEEGENHIRKHFEALKISANDDILIHTAKVPPNPIESLRSSILEYKPSLVIVDTLFRIINVNDGNSYSQVQKALEPITDLAKETGCHILLVHHMTKGDRDGAEGILGSTALFGAVDTAIMLNRTEKFSTIRTRQRGGYDLEETILEFDQESRSFTLGNSKKEDDKERLKTEIIDLLSQTKGVISNSDIKEKLVGKSETINEAIRELADSGKIQRSGTGKKGDPFCFQLNIGRSATAASKSPLMFQGKEPDFDANPIASYKSNKDESTEECELEEVEI